MVEIPEKLKADAIVEALLEIRFEHSDDVEKVLASLVSSKVWVEHRTQSLPQASIPAVIREADVNLRYEPTIQLVSADGLEIVKIGYRVVSLHLLAPYPGWTKFEPKLAKMIAELFKACSALNIERLGLRYVNALTPAHGFENFWQMTLDLSVRGEHPSDQIITGYSLQVGGNKKVQMKVASPEFIEGKTVDGAVAYIDVDVQSVERLGDTDERSVLDWIVEAHKAEKKAFFALWPDEKIERMRA